MSDANLADGKFTPSSRDGMKAVTQLSETKAMTCRYAHKRVAMLFTAVQNPPTARVIDWPQKASNSAEHRARLMAGDKSPREVAYADK